VVGGEHAAIYRDYPGITNSAFLIDHGAFYHPGDALFVPEQSVDVLGAPVAAPWMKTSEAVDFIRAVKPRVAVPIHEKILSSPEMGYSWLENFTKDVAPLKPLTAGEATEV
jgi:L-ascorbate metabolism protein UlaG (beta-lactamase superfamily)